jgi:aryl-alcohol dehydrogenase
MEIKAAVVFEKSAKFSIEKLQISDPNDDEVLVRIVGTGICHTDIAGREQYLPIPLFSDTKGPVLLKKLALG